MKKIAGGILGLSIGIIGNLTASWIQADLLQNFFNPYRLIVIFALGLLGIVAVARLDSREEKQKAKKSPPIFISKIRLLWSQMFIKAANVKLEDVISIKSTIEINNNEEKKK